MVADQENTGQPSRFQEFLKLLIEESREYFAKEKPLEQAYQALTKAFAETFSVPRVSVWILKDGESRAYVECADIYEKKERKHSSGVRLFEKDFPKYFEYVRANVVLNTYDTRTDYYTRDFSESYLIPLGIFSMMDAPFHLHGKVYGVICCENTQTFRHWSLEEEQALIAMCSHLSSFVSHSHLETLIEERTSELKKNQAQLIQSSKMASLGVMASGIAHEINNPLAIIRANGELLGRLLESDSFDREKVMKFLSSTDSTVQRISDIIRGLQSFSRDSTQDPMHRVSAQQIVKDTLAFCAEKIRHGGIQLKLEPSSDAQVHCRPAEIGQILLNLLQNASDAVQGTLNPWISVEILARSGKVEFHVVDSGHGIAPEIEAKIFDLFFTTKEVGKGTGLGLGISQEIAKTHDGRLYYDKTSSNTRFVLELPLSPRGRSC